MGEIHVMREDLRPPGQPPRRHFISITDVTRDDIERLQEAKLLELIPWAYEHSALIRST